MQNRLVVARVQQLGSRWKICDYQKCSITNPMVKTQLCISTIKVVTGIYTQIQLHRMHTCTQISVGKTGKISVRLLAIYFLVVMLYCNYTRYSYHCVKLCEGVQGTTVHYYQQLHMNLKFQNKKVKKNKVCDLNAKYCTM